MDDYRNPAKNGNGGQYLPQGNRLQYKQGTSNGRYHGHTELQTGSPGGADLWQNPVPERVTQTGSQGTG